ncbi:MAG: efflux RND transporter permease subunit [Gemmatimonadota bacterium]
MQRGSMERLNPVLMTALAAGLALIPLAIAGGDAGNEIVARWRSPCWGGVLSAVVLNMMVVPALYLRYGAKSRAASSPDAEDARAALALDEA